MSELVKKVVITGPESTGKTMLAESLSKILNVPWIPEFAREYVERIGRPYVYADVEAIARQQIEDEINMSNRPDSGLFIMDTWLIITKIWFEQVFGNAPVWIEEYISKADIDLFLVCKTDLPWIPDSVRENGGEKRELLLSLYCKEIESYGFKYEMISGTGEQRIRCALNSLKRHRII